MKRQALIGVVAAALFAFAGISFAQAPAQAGAQQDQTVTAPAHKKAAKHVTKREHKKVMKKHTTKAASATTHHKGNKGN